MRKILIFVFSVVVFVLAVYPTQASAQLFRRRAAAEEEEKGAHGAKSKLPEYSSAPYLSSGLPIVDVPAEIKNEMQGRAQVRPVPDFSQQSVVGNMTTVIYKAMRPASNSREGTRVKPPAQQVSPEMYDLFFNQPTVKQAAESQQPLSQSDAVKPTIASSVSVDGVVLFGSYLQETAFFPMVNAR